jgi:hypothetical protein
MVVALCVALGCSSPEKRRLGETFDIGTTSYTVKSREVRSQIRVGGVTMEAGRGANFVIISYLIANHGKDYISVNPLNLRLVTPDQAEYQADLSATYALKMQSALESSSPEGGAELPAGQSGSYTAVFRVPQDTARSRFDVVVRHRVSVVVD